MKKGYYLFATLFILLFMLVYFTRFEFRNNDGWYGKILNSMFNMNRISLLNPPKELDIYWTSELEKVQIVANSKVLNTNFGNQYGINKFQLFIKGNKIYEFVFFNIDKKNSYDFEFIFNKDQVEVKASNHLEVLLKKENAK
ncbi:hypothetical protein [Fluviicola taffensis]|uniref:hypothetical protein n=1 Tax=Fluviicola taffensis TaxID=191579 RepID=UPI00313772DB